MRGWSSLLASVLMMKPCSISEVSTACDVIKQVVYKGFGWWMSSMLVQRSPPGFKTSSLPWVQEALTGSTVCSAIFGSDKYTDKTIMIYVPCIPRFLQGSSLSGEKQGYYGTFLSSHVWYFRCNTTLGYKNTRF